MLGPLVGGLLVNQILHEIVNTDLIEEFFITIEKSSEVDIFVKITVPVSNIVHDTFLLLIWREYNRWQKTMNAQDLALPQSECHTLQTSIMHSN